MLFSNSGVFAVFLVLLLRTASLGQIPRMESGEDCIDWFLLSWNELEKCHAVVGHAESADSSGGGFVELEWFEIKCIDEVTKGGLHYCETRALYADAPNTGFGIPWTKSLAGRKKLLACFGELSEPLEEFEPPVFDSKGKLVSGMARREFAPNAFALAVMTGSGFRMSEEFGCHYFSKTFGEMKKIEQQDDSIGNKSVFIFNGVQSREIVADREHGMPIVTSGYFRDKTRKGEPDRTFFPVLNYEAKTTWESLDDGKTFVPTTVDNFVNRTHPLHKGSSAHVQVAVAYAVKDIRAELLSTENLSNYLMRKGPTAELRAELQEKVRKRTAELRRK